MGWWGLGMKQPVGREWKRGGMGWDGEVGDKSRGEAEAWRNGSGRSDRHVLSELVIEDSALGTGHFSMDCPP